MTDILAKYGLARLGVLSEAKGMFRGRGRKTEKRTYGLKLKSLKQSS